MGTLKFCNSNCVIFLGFYLGNPIYDTICYFLRDSFDYEAIDIHFRLAMTLVLVQRCFVFPMNF